MAGYWNCSNKTPTPISIYIFLADAVPRPEKTGNRLGILTQFLIAVDYHFFFIYISEKYLQFRKIQKHLFSKIFGSPHTRNRIYFLLNCFSNCGYLKDMCITLKGVGKILFGSVLIILLISKFLNFTVTFSLKKIEFQCENVNPLIPGGNKKVTHT